MKVLDCMDWQMFNACLRHKVECANADVAYLQNSVVPGVCFFANEQRLKKRRTHYTVAAPPSAMIMKPPSCPPGA